MSSETVTTAPALPPVLSSEEIDAARARLEGCSPLEVLEWAADRFAPRLTCATGFGVGGCVLISLIGEHRLPIDLFTLDTGLLFPETHALWQTLEARYRVKIRAVNPDQSVGEQAHTHGDARWAREAARSCELRKVQPLRRALSGFDAWITAIRREPTAARPRVGVIDIDPQFGLVTINPLVNWTAGDVRRFVATHDVPHHPRETLAARGLLSATILPAPSAVGF